MERRQRPQGETKQPMTIPDELPQNVLDAYAYIFELAKKKLDEQDRMEEKESQELAESSAGQAISENDPE
jgi:cation transport regulator ChaB